MGLGLTVKKKTTSSGSSQKTTPQTTTQQTSGKTYQVQSNGKAPSGLVAGDRVVTENGTYRIDGVKADGSYQSTWENDVSTKTYNGTYANSPSITQNSQYTQKSVPSGFNGSATGVKTYNDAQKSWVDEMNANSIAWHTASPEEQESLSNRNKALKELLGGSVEFDPNTGYWTGVAEFVPDEFDYDEMLEQRPEFNDRYQGISEDLLNKILSREDFSYDPSDDPLFGYFQDMYRREGDRARENTLADIAASAGGMNSWAVTAAQQAQNDYNAQMTDKIPELYQLAYQMYLNDKASDVENLGLLQQMSDSQYGRYRDQMSDFYNDLNFAYGMYRDDVADGQWNKQFDYNVGRDQIADDRYKTEWEYGVSTDQYNREQAERDSARAWALDLIAAGVTPDDATLQKAELTLDQAKQILANGQQTTARRTSSSRSGGGGDTAITSGDVYQQMYDAGITSEADAYLWLISRGVNKTNASTLGKYYMEKFDEGSIESAISDPDQLFNLSIKRLGLGSSATDELIKELEKYGAIVEDGNYGFKWAHGWNADNWETMLLLERSGFKDNYVAPDAFGTAGKKVVK